MATREFKVCDLTGRRRDVQTYRVYLVRHADSEALINTQIDLGPAGLLKLCRRIEAAMKRRTRKVVDDDPT